MSSSCIICDQLYDRNNCKPLILPCGHTMCRECLLKFKEKSKICVVCNKSWADSSVESLPVCLQLIPGAIMKSVCNLWCNTCHSTSCVKNELNEGRTCDLIRLDDNCLQRATEYTDLCKKIKIKKINFEKILEEITALSKTLNEEIYNLSHCENQNKEHNMKEDDSEETLAILDNNIKLCQESLLTKLPITTSPFLSPILSALQVNSYCINYNKLPITTSPSLSPIRSLLSS